MNVDQMLRRLTWPQLKEWMAYEDVEPFGERRADWQAAAICTAFANVTIASRGGRKRFRVKDFLLEFDDQAKAVKEGDDVPAGQSWQQMKFIAQMWAAAFNADDGKKKKKNWGR